MVYFRSIRHTLYSVFVFFLLIVLGFGIFSTDRLRVFNETSAGVRERWLPNTRFLGDLNNFTSDFRAAEGSTLIASTPAQIGSIRGEVRDLDRAIARSARGYEQNFHNPAELREYRQFVKAWSDYRHVADSVFQLADHNAKSAAATMYMMNSRAAYQRASDRLGQLTNRNADSARSASTAADAAYRDAEALTMLAFAFAAAMVTASIVYIRRSISEPLLNLAQSMRLVASNAADVEIGGTDRRDEVGEMARAVVIFRNNAVDLALSQKGLAEQASMLREKLEQERRLATLQRNFVSMASHEFRTPLAIIDAHAQRLIAGEARLKPADISTRARKIRSSVLRMTSLIEGLLGSSLLENRVELYLHPSQFDLVGMLDEVCHLHREISPHSQIYSRMGGNPIHVYADRKLLFQVFSNLLSNAIKYSPNGGLIKLCAAQKDDVIEILVKDSGIGISQGDISHLFDRYYRGKNVSGIVGTGIGLYFAKMVIELHQGTVAVESEEGRGACFTVRLPAISIAPQPDAAGDVHETGDQPHEAVI